MKGPKIPPGGLWGEARIQLRLMNNRDFDIKPDTPRDACSAGETRVDFGRAEPVLWDCFVRHLRPGTSPLCRRSRDG